MTPAAQGTEGEMSHNEWTTIDKSAWGPGAWQDEPDKIHWIDPATDLDCLMVRQPRAGHWCGYVGVTDGHPFFEQDYDNCRTDGEDGWLNVHGGLTYAAFCAESDDPATGVCHVPKPGRPHKVWWLGFDCAHLGDLSPARAARDRGGQWESMHDADIYRDRSYVEAEVRSLAAQVKAASR